MTTVNSSTSAQLLVAADGSRTSLTIQNTDANELFIGIDNTVSQTNYTYRRVYGTGYTFDGVDAQQAYYGIWDADGTGGAVITEITTPVSDGNGAGIGTYAQLKTAVAAWLRPNSTVTSDMTTNIPRYVGLAEVMIRREIHLRNLDQTTTALAISDGVAAVPEGFMAAMSMTLVDSPYNQVRMLPIDQLDMLNPTLVADKPFYYSRSGSNFYFYPKTDATAQLRFRRGVTPLSSDGDTNWILAAHPDVYLSAALVCAARRLIDPRLGEFQSWFAESLASIQKLELFQHSDQILPQPSGFVV